MAETCPAQCPQGWRRAQQCPSSCTGTQTLSAFSSLPHAHGDPLQEEAETSWFCRQPARQWAQLGHLSFHGRCKCPRRRPGEASPCPDGLSKPPTGIQPQPGMGRAAGNARLGTAGSVFCAKHGSSCPPAPLAVGTDAVLLPAGHEKHLRGVINAPGLRLLEPRLSSLEVAVGTRRGTAPSKGQGAGGRAVLLSCPHLPHLLAFG